MKELAVFFGPQGRIMQAIGGDGVSAGETLAKIQGQAHTLYLNTYFRACLNDIEVVIPPRGDFPRTLWRLAPRKYT